MNCHIWYWLALLSVVILFMSQPCKADEYIDVSVYKTFEDFYDTLEVTTQYTNEFDNGWFITGGVSYVVDEYNGQLESVNRFNVGFGVRINIGD